MCLTEFNEKVFIEGIRAEGKVEGTVEGIAEGRISSVCEMITKCYITPRQGAEILGISLSTLNRYMEEHHYI